VANDAKKNKKIREIRPIRVVRVKIFWAFERVTYVFATTKNPSRECRQLARIFSGNLAETLGKIRKNSVTLCLRG
jgi:hypothetical protein